MDAELLPPLRQALWGRLAAANFFLGGAGAGAWLVGVALFGFSPTPPVGRALALAPLLVLVGFLGVAAEAGRPLRGPRVLRMVGSSWMSRELWVGGAFIGLAALDSLWPWLGWRLAAALAALLFALAQGWILARCRGIAAWNVPLLPPVFLASALVSGAGVLGLIFPLASPDPDGGDRLALAMAALILVSAVAWVAYTVWPGDDTFRRTALTLRESSAIVGIFIIGHLLPLVALLLGLWAPTFLPAATVLAGAGILIGQLQAKAWMILRAGVLRPITLPGGAVRMTATQIGHRS